MKNYLYLLFSLLMLIQISCSKDRELDQNIEQNILSQSLILNDNFLDNSYARGINNNICKQPGDTTNAIVIQQMKSQLNTVKNNNSTALLSLADNFGYPVWDANMTGTGSNGNDWYLIPMVTEGQSKTHSILVANRLPDESFELNFYKRYDIVQHFKNNDPSNINFVKDIYSLFTFCDCAIFCEVADDSINFTEDRSVVSSRNQFVTVTWSVSNDPLNFCEPGFHTEVKVILAGCTAGGGGSGGGIAGGSGIFWGGGTGTGGGIDTGGGSSQGGGGGGSSSNPFGLDCVPSFEIASYFELLTEVEGFITNYNINFSASQIVEYISPSCLSDLSTFDQCVLNHLKCLGLEISGTLGLSTDATAVLINNPTSTTLSVVKFLEKEKYSLGAKEYVTGVIDLILDDPLLKMDRFIELYYLFEEDNDFLVRDCLENQNPSGVDFSDLINYVPPSNVLARLTDLGEGWRLQPLETPSASPSINMDYFSVVIDQMPINPSTGIAWTPDALFKHFRVNISNFASNTDFEPLTAADGTLWQSNNPVTAVLSINIPGPDNGSVICAQNESCCWIFATVKAPNLQQYDGYHPVSGNRQFGYRILTNGSMEIYIQGVDRFLSPLIVGGNYLPDVARIDKLAGYLMENLAFHFADELWISVQESIKSFVEQPSYEGSATINTPITFRPKINQQLVEILRSSNKIEYVPCIF